MYLRFRNTIVVDTLTLTDLETDSRCSQDSRRIPQGKATHHNCCGILRTARYLRAGAVLMRVDSSINIEGENHMYNNMAGDGGGEQRFQQLASCLLQR